jgi:ribonuclease BN (tRNA processing enzyme)
MRILQLGNGGGLNPLMTNSSFLIDIGYENKPEYILFDCGFNIMERLIKGEEAKEFLIKDISTVFISHNDDDHIGNLQTFIYWQYFKNQISLKIISSHGILNIAEDKFNKLMFGGLMTYTKLVDIKIHEESNLGYNDPKVFFGHKNGDTFLYLIKSYHGDKNCYGLMIFQRDELIYISGDTKAHQKIESAINLISGFYMKENNVKISNFLLFHDYSNWNAPSRNVHACIGDFTIEYSKEFQEKCIKYHTGTDDFVKEWRVL